MDNIHKIFSQAKIFLIHLLDPNPSIVMLLWLGRGGNILKRREAPRLLKR